MMLESVKTFWAVEMEFMSFAYDKDLKFRRLKNEVLWTEYLCSYKIHMLKPYAPSDDMEMGIFWR